MSSIPAGLSVGTMIASLFLAKSARPVTPGPSSWTASIQVGLAEAKTSTGAPSLICVARPSDGPKLKVTVAPGSRSSNASPMSVNASVSEEAADTVSAISLRSSPAHPALRPSSESPHAASSRAASTA